MRCQANDREIHEARCDDALMGQHRYCHMDFRVPRPELAQKRRVCPRNHPHLPPAQKLQPYIATTRRMHIENVKEGDTIIGVRLGHSGGVNIGGLSS